MRQSMASLCFGGVLFLVGVAPSWGGTYARWHPDQFNFQLAMERIADGDEAAALDCFRRAARYADKPAQMAIALLLFEGRGVAADRALAYAWSDVAAERGYPAFIAVRERLWDALDAAEQARAIREGQSLYAEYGDAVAKPRLERLLLQGLARKTGSRTGAGETSRLGIAFLGDAAAQAAFKAAFFTTSAGPFTAFIKGVGAAGDTEANLGSAGYYDPANWQPARYWAARDAVWMPTGEVEVQPLRALDERTRR